MTLRILAFLSALIPLVGCASESARIDIADPCNTFVSEFAPNRTPSLFRADDGQLLLEISFTPAKNKEATRIYSAVKRRPTMLRVTKTGRELQALRLGVGSIIFPVASREEAEAVLSDLCFKKTDLVVAQKEPNQAVQTTPGLRPSVSDL